FFQAEDGIRDGHVTGVQTCALPILSGARRGNVAADTGIGNPDARPRQGANNDAALCRAHSTPVSDLGGDVVGRAGATRQDRGRRSEERRVGKEGGSRWLAEEGRRTS